MLVVLIKNMAYVINVAWEKFNQFMRKDAGKPVMRTKLKNLVNGNSLDKTFLAGESYEFIIHKKL